MERMGTTGTWSGLGSRPGRGSFINTQPEINRHMTHTLSQFDQLVADMQRNVGPGSGFGTPRAGNATAAPSGSKPFDPPPKYEMTLEEGESKKSRGESSGDFQGDVHR